MCTLLYLQFTAFVDVGEDRDPSDGDWFLIIQGSQIDSLSTYMASLA